MKGSVVPPLPMGGPRGWGGARHYLQVVFSVDGEAVTEHVPHDEEVGLLAVHAHPVHPQEARQQRAAVTLHHVLGGEDDMTVTHQNTR